MGTTPTMGEAVLTGVVTGFTAVSGVTVLLVTAGKFCDSSVDQSSTVFFPVEIKSGCLAK